MSSELSHTYRSRQVPRAVPFPWIESKETSCTTNANEIMKPKLFRPGSKVVVRFTDSEDDWENWLVRYCAKDGILLQGSDNGIWDGRCQWVEWDEITQINRVDIP